MTPFFGFPSSALSSWPGARMRRLSENWEGAQPFQNQNAQKQITSSHKGMCDSMVDETLLWCPIEKLRGFNLYQGHEPEGNYNFRWRPNHGHYLDDDAMTIDDSENPVEPKIGSQESPGIEFWPFCSSERHFIRIQMRRIYLKNR